MGVGNERAASVLGSVLAMVIAISVRLEHYFGMRRGSLRARPDSDATLTAKQS